MSIRSIITFIAASYALIISSHANAKPADFPDHPVRIIVPSSPGGALDFLARLVGSELSKTWGQSVVVENRAGAGGVVGSQIVAQAQPDGYTLLFVATGYTVNPAIYAKLPYDSLKDFAPVTLLAETSHVIAASSHSNIKTFAQLLQQVKEKPGNVTYAISGIGTGGWLTGELLKKDGHLNMLAVPYKGSGAATAGAVAGQTDLLITDVGPVLPFAQSGQLIPLAVTSLHRSPKLPNVPTIAESGIKDFQIGAWAAVLAPGGTPSPRVHKIQHDIAKVINIPSIKEKLIAQGYVGVGSTPEEFRKLSVAEMAKWDDLLKTSGVKRLTVH